MVNLVIGLVCPSVCVSVQNHISVTTGRNFLLLGMMMGDDMGLLIGDDMGLMMGDDMGLMMGDDMRLMMGDDMGLLPTVSLCGYWTVFQMDRQKCIFPKEALML